MLKRELKLSRNSLMLWTLILIFLYFIIYLVYPSIASNNNVDINKLLKMFPEEVLKTFNMDISGIDSVFGWFKSEGYMFLTLVTALYSSILGSNILVKEESDKTIEFLYSKPVNRNKIILSRILCGIINIVLLITMVCIFNIIGMKLSDDLNLKQLLIISFLPLISSLSIFFVSLFLSTFFNKTKKTMSISIAIVFLSYFLKIVGNLGESTKIFKYFSIFELSSIRKVILENTINYNCMLIGMLIIIVSITGIFISYNKKELV